MSIRFPETCRYCSFGARMYNDCVIVWNKYLWASLTPLSAGRFCSNHDYYTYLDMQTEEVTLQGTTGKALCFCQRRVKGRGGYLQAFTHHTAIHAAVWVAHKLTITAAILSTAAPTTGSNCTQNDWKTSRHLEGHTQFKTTSKIHLSKQSGVTHLFVCLAQIASQWDSPLHFIYFPALQLSMDFFFFSFMASCMQTHTSNSNSVGRSRIHKTNFRA